MLGLETSLKTDVALPDANDLVLDTVSSLNDFKIRDETISRSAEMAYFLKLRYFYELVILIMFRK